MKTLECECGRKVKNVDDNAVAVMCYLCLNGTQPIDPNAPIPEEKPQEPKQEKPKPEPKKSMEIVVFNKDDSTATGQANGIQFKATRKMGLDKKLHWILEGDWSRGQRIAISRKINAKS